MKNDFLVYGIISIMVLGIFGFIGGVYTKDTVKSGTSIDLYADLSNPTGSKMHNLHIRAFFMDSADSILSQSFTLDTVGNRIIPLYYSVPSDMKGEQAIRVILEDDNNVVQDSKYVFVNVI